MVEKLSLLTCVFINYMPRYKSTNNTREVLSDGNRHCANPAQNKRLSTWKTRRGMDNIKKDLREILVVMVEVERTSSH